MFWTSHTVRISTYIITFIDTYYYIKYLNLSSSTIFYIYLPYGDCIVEWYKQNLWSNIASLVCSVMRDVIIFPIKCITGDNLLIKQVENPHIDRPRLTKKNELRKLISQLLKYSDYNRCFKNQIIFLAWQSWWFPWPRGANRLSQSSVRAPWREQLR